MVLMPPLRTNSRARKSAVCRKTSGWVVVGSNRGNARRQWVLRADGRFTSLLAALEVTGSSGGDMVVVKMNGTKEILYIKIDKEVVDPEDTEMLEDLVLTAVNEALNKSREEAAKQLGGLTGGMKIPGLM